jgi:hypothetical protein
MKKILFLTLLSLCPAFAYAQSLLVNTLKPVEQQHYRLQESAFKIGGQVVSNSFSLDAPDGGLIGSNEQAYVTFNLNGKYDKLTFLTGPANANPNGIGHNGILVVTADGRTRMDEVIHDYDEVKYVTLDVAGINQISFKLVKGSQDVGIGVPKLWKAGQTATVATNPMDKLPKGRVKLVEQHMPYYTRGSYVKLITKDENVFWNNRTESISINRKTFDSGLEMNCPEGLVEDEKGWSYFWLNKRYDKVSFIVGPRDNQSSKSTAWLIVKADKRTVYEGIVTQKDLARQIVVDVAGAEQVSFMCERRSGDILGNITFGVTEMYAYPESYADIPQEGVVNLNKDKIAALPDVCPLLSNIRPFSLRGFNKADDVMFYGETKHYHFSMGGVQYWEGMLFTTGNNLMEDMIDSYAEFDLAGEFDYLSFDVGCLTKRHALDDDLLRIYADGKLVFDQMIYCTWPNRHFVIPLNKCRTLRFEKPGNGKKKQTVIGVGDIVLYRGQPVENDIFVHEVPDCPRNADLIDLCGAPYFHYCGRFVSSLTNFSMDGCFHDGSTRREFFRMKDGSEIYKGFMLETNVAMGLEDVSVMDAMFMFLTGGGANVSSSAVAAYTGTTGGASGPFTGGISLLLFNGEHQSSAAAFNPFGEYESCTFTVANVYEHVDEFDKTFGNKSKKALLNPVKLNVFADQRLVGEFWLDNKTEPTTITVPIFKCRQLMFWLECGDQRSGQFVFYDLKVSKDPCTIPIPEHYSTNISTDSGKSSKESVKSEKKVVSEEEKQKRREKAAKAVNVGLDIIQSLLK